MTAMYSEMLQMGKAVIIEYFKVLSRHSPGRIQEIHKNPRLQQKMQVPW
jgi:hypothetical protein